MTHTDPRTAVDGLAAARAPFLIGVRHHSPALAAVVPALLDASGADAVCVELPADFQNWVEHLADPETVAPVALAGSGEDGRLAFYPFADFSPELAAIRWARRSGAVVLCCDLPLSDPGWTPRPAVPHPSSPADRPDTVPEASPRAADATSNAASRTVPVRATGTATRTDTAAESGGAPRPAGGFAAALTAAGTGRDGDDLWDRAVEVLAPGCSPEAVRRAALGVGWALREDGPVPARDLAREAHMHAVIAGAIAGGRRVAAVIGSFHAPALLGPEGNSTAVTAPAAGGEPAPEAGSPTGTEGAP
ncbi:DUF5682 family protein, partial [Streptomyces sp. NPDC058874]